jgi:hypothetical protein
LFRATGEDAAGSENGGNGASLSVVNGVARRVAGSRSAGGTSSGRQRHDEKITVYVSAEELVHLERARIALRADHGIAVDRGRIVREALAYLLADLDEKGATSILVRELHQR